MCELLCVLLVLGAFVIVSLLALGLVLKLAFVLIILPVKAFGAILHVGLAGLGLGLKILIGLVGFIVGIILLFVVVPLLPLLILAGFAWVVIRLFTLCFP
jgi:hypothetical protein